MHPDENPAGWPPRYSARNAHPERARHPGVLVAPHPVVGLPPEQSRPGQVQGVVDSNPRRKQVAGFTCMNTENKTVPKLTKARKRFKRPFWGPKNGGCALHDSPRTRFECPECSAEIPKLRAEVVRLRKIITDASRAALKDGAK